MNSKYKFREETFDYCPIEWLSLSRYLRADNKRKEKMAWIITIIVGGIIGWIASLIMRTKQGVAADIIIGILGSILGVWLFTDVFGIGPIVMPGTLSLLNIIWGIIGAIILIAIMEAISYDRSVRSYNEEEREHLHRPGRTIPHEYKESNEEDVTIIKKKRPRRK